MRLLCVLLLLFASSTFAEELQRQTITSCAYQAGTAEEIQRIRQQEGDDWATFESKVNKIYKPSQGRTDLLVIAKRVYLHSVATPTDEVHADILQACVARAQGTEPKV